MATVSMKDLLKAGVHFGHQTRRWNPKMEPYIFTERNGIYIMDLQRTLKELSRAYKFVQDTTSRGGKVLFVGTKKQAQEPMEREAERAGQPYVTQRWLGGMLTNWVTIKTRIQRMEEIERMEQDGSFDALPKKEVLQLQAEHAKLDRNLSGIREMGGLPDAVFVIDTKKEAIAIAEARRLGIPIVGVVDTNSDPDEVDYVIPGNDDALRSVNLLCRVVADAALSGKMSHEGKQGDLGTEEQTAAAAEQAASDQGETAETAVAADVPETDEVAEATEATEAADAAPSTEAAPEGVTEGMQGGETTTGPASVEPDVSEPADVAEEPAAAVEDVEPAPAEPAAAEESGPSAEEKADAEER